MRNEKKMILAAILAGCVALGGCAPQAEDAEAVEEKNVVTGTVECKEVYVRAKIAGYLTDIPVVEGQEVQEGDLLFSSDRRDVEVKQTQASGTREAAAGTADAAAGQMEAAQKAIDAAQALIDKASANVSLLETEYVKYQELYAMDAVAEDTMDKLTTQLDAARLDMQAAIAQKEAAQGQYEAAQGQYQAALGQLSAANGVLAEVALNLDQTSQYAPCNGTVTMISSSVGELIGSGTTIVTLTDYSDRWIIANVDEYALGNLQLGQEVPLTSKAYPDKVFKGKIINISKNPDFAIKKSTNELNDQDVVTYEVKIALTEDADIMLYPGMLVSVDLDGAKAIKETSEAVKAGEAE